MAIGAASFFGNRSAGRPVPDPVAEGDALLDALRTVDTFPGAALLFAADGRLKHANAGARTLAAATPGQDGGLHGLIAKVAGSGRALASRLSLPQPDDPAAGPLCYDLSLVPLSLRAPHEVLVLGVETTLERNLLKALAKSRELYRDLASCSSDFSWETDGSGAFTYVSARGAAGYSAQALNGKLAASLICHDRIDPAAAATGVSENVFLTREPVEEVEVWLRGADGRDHCMIVSAVPVFDAKSQWTGARGVARDVTTAREQQAELARVRRRDRLVDAVVYAMRSEVDPVAMLKACATATADAIGATACWIFRDGDEAAIESAGRHTAHDPDRFGPALDDLHWLEAAAARLAAGEEMVEMIADGLNILVQATEYRGGSNGMICIVRPEDAMDWAEDDRFLLRGIASQTGIAIAQAAQLDKLRELSETDELTGLLNRRAFFEQGARRIAHHRRMARPAALLYLDLDGFKRVNDTEGHAAGDRVLKAIAGLLSETSRAADLATRLGGDEFAIWLEETPAEGAIVKAEHLLDAARELFAADPVMHGLGISIGISLFDPDDEGGLETLIARADAALYEVKRSGKNAWRIHAPETAGDAAKEFGETGAGPLGAETHNAGAAGSGEKSR